MWPYVDWYCSKQTFDCSQALAETTASFSTKSTLTNVYNTCNVREQINVYSYDDGSWFVDFWRFGACGHWYSPTHNVTAAKVSDYESSGYGGKTVDRVKMSIARPYVDGV